MLVLAVEILNHLVVHPQLIETLQFQQVQCFLEFTERIWPEIVGKSGVILVTLPAHPASFLSSVLVLAPEIIALSWLAFSDIAATLQQEVAEPSLDDGFRVHGNDHQIGRFYSFLTYYVN
jgi:hypothetical protein